MKKRARDQRRWRTIVEALCSTRSQEDIKLNYVSHSSSGAVVRGEAGRLLPHVNSKQATQSSFSNTGFNLIIK